MNPKVLIGIIAFICGMGTFYFASNYMKKGNQGLKMVAVLRTTKKIPPREKITEPENYFELKEMPEGSFPPKTVLDFNKVKDKALNKFVAKDYFVTEDDLLAPGQSDFADQLTPGMRLYGLSVGPESLAGGFVKSGSYVDVIGTRRIANSKVETQTIIQNVRVMAVGDNTSIQNGEKRNTFENTVTLEIAPEHFQILGLWETNGGKITLSGYGTAGLIEKGMRLFSLSVSPGSLAGGFVLPGTKVDVIGTRRIANSKVETQTIIQNVRVMAVGEKTSIQNGEKLNIIESTVTLEMTPEQIQNLATWKTTVGEIKLAARRPTDKSIKEEVKKGQK